ncbi:MotA/TolQ/ExbB proton channel family protein [Candidatus Latescibacterota bacterium]
MKRNCTVWFVSFVLFNIIHVSNSFAAISFNSFSEKVGPVFWPQVFLAIPILASLLLAVFALFRDLSAEDKNFIKRMKNFVDTAGNMAMALGILGTCMGIIQMLPELVEASKGDSTSKLELLKFMANVFASTGFGVTIAGILTPFSTWVMGLILPKGSEERIRLYFPGWRALL